jgi:hypothetical protein
MLSSKSAQSTDTALVLVRRSAWWTVQKEENYLEILQMNYEGDWVSRAILHTSLGFWPLTLKGP